MSTIKRIIELAKENGTKLSYLNNLIGGYHGKLTECKNGKTTLTNNEIKAIADFFDVSVDYLQCKTDEKTSNNLERPFIMARGGEKRYIDKDTAELFIKMIDMIEAKTSLNDKNN